MHQRQKRQAPNQDLSQRTCDVTYAYDLDGNFTFMNEEGERLSGYSCEEVRHMNITELLDPAGPGPIHEQILNNPKARVGQVYEVDIIAKDGRRVPLEVSTRVVSEAGLPIEIQGIALPSVIRGQGAKRLRQRCLDEAFSRF